ncbi:MAG: hypothetical protein LBD85_01140, partial [Oscillospiraceae bacterium]|nr:hypothetical protein [Oscillospiraceae bacterium]
MAHSKPLIPSAGAAYDIFFANIVEYVTARATLWNFIPETERTALKAAYTDWHAAYIPTTRPHTPGVTTARNLAYKRTKAVLSRFIKVWFRGFPEKVTDDDLVNMGIPPIDTDRTPIPPPENQVEADITFPGIHMVELQRIRPVAGTAPDARSDYGVRIYYGITGEVSEALPFRLDGPVKTAKVLPYSVFTRRKK